MALTTEARQKLAEQFPNYAYLLNNGEIASLLERYINEGRNEGWLKLELSKTDWWKHTSPSMRKWAAGWSQDPGGNEEQLRQKLAQVNDMWLKLGGQDRAANDPWAQNMATRALEMGWDENQLNDAIVSTFSDRPNMTPPTGTLGTYMNQLTDLSYQWGVPVDVHTAFSWARNIVAGEKDVDAYSNLLREQAKSKFPTISKYIEQGIKPSDYFAPYKQQIGQLLEKDATSIDILNDPKWSKVIQTSDKDGQLRPMTLSETATYTRGLDEWKKTSQAQEQAATQAETILKTFGQRAS